MRRPKILARRLEHDLFDRPVRADGINSKEKGDANERVAAGWVFKWTGFKFIRSPSSGGRRLENNSSFCGDIVCEDETHYFPFVIETKHLKLVHTPPKLNVNSAIYTIWKQAKRDAERASKQPMLMLRGHGYPKGSYIIFVRAKVAVFFISEGLREMSRGVTQDGEVIVGFDSNHLLHLSYTEVVEYVNKLN